MIPEHIEEMDGGHVCKHCGGAVDEGGLSMSLEDAEEEPSLGAVESKFGEPDEAKFAEAVKASSGGRMR